MEARRLSEYDVDNNVLLHLHINAFIKMSGEEERTPDSIRKQMKNALREGGRLWSIETKDSLRGGYMLARISNTEYESTAVIIEQVYVDPKLSRNVWTLLHNVADTFGREHGAAEMFFITRRSAGAFMRRLQRGWRQDSVIMRRPIF